MIFAGYHWSRPYQKSTHHDGVEAFYYDGNGYAIGYVTRGERGWRYYDGLTGPLNATDGVFYSSRESAMEAVERSVAARVL
jgi:hypothetical protein